MSIGSIEYLTALLSYSGIKNARKTAEELIGRLGNLGAVIQTDAYKLEAMGFDPRAVALIRLCAELTSRRITDRYKSGKRYSHDEIRELTAGLLFACTAETVYMLTFDNGGKFIAADCIDAGTVNSSGIIPRKVLDTALRRKAKGIILAHNHPCGRPLPSENDVTATMAVASVCESAGISLYAHYVTAGLELYDCMTDVPTVGREEKILKVSAAVKEKI